MKKLIGLLLLSIASFSYADQEQALDWQDLIPEAERLQNTQSIPQFMHQGPGVQNTNVTVREDLNDKLVGLTGFVIPLEGDANSITEFLLVPFLGACIHVPPPPPNQLVYVKFENGVPPSELWDVVYVIGKLKTVPVDTDGIMSGYLIEGTEVRTEEL
ncbi:hypothetical protein CS022_17735 [Veronia nyctiphanis]|uniref:DUF3299 domain-containing protein n=1 Tax=Veronia nyctiphanis TaxID=1278244 RepID=A0A4Q0YML4_9GAMM|nr:DUF3299 domain-containing protein [Veronia nyctiphanis]RXJ72112.1 hypothetical protein CS022_17735 [Veronia nyctiphanis]